MMALLLALILGVPTLRLRADYLAIVTIAAGEIIRLGLRANSYRETTGGSDGLQAFADAFYDLNPFSGGSYGIWVITFPANRFWVVCVGWALVGLVALFLYLLTNSPWGRVLKGIREDEDAVRSLGKDVFKYKMQSLAIGGVLGALGGVMFAIDRQSVQPDNYSTNFTFICYTAIILGGVARVGGPDPRRDGVLVHHPGHRRRSCARRSPTATSTRSSRPTRSASSRTCSPGCCSCSW